MKDKQTHLFGFLTNIFVLIVGFPVIFIHRFANPDTADTFANEYGGYCASALVVITLLHMYEYITAD